MMQRIYKIWFAKKGAHPLGSALNEYRLSLHRVRFPKDELHLVTNLEILSNENKKQIKDFCEKYNIKLMDLTDVEKALNANEFPDKKVQQALFEIAKIEANSDFGNLAAASDVIRLLSPVVKLGLYMDCDVHKLEDRKTQSKLGFAFNMISCATETSMGFHSTNNNIFYFDEKINPLILSNIRLNLLEKYQWKDKFFLRKVRFQLLDLGMGATDAENMLIKIDALIKENISKKYPLLYFRSFMKETFGFSSNIYFILNRAITMVTGPINFADSIDEYISINLGSSRLTPKFFKMMSIKMPFKDDADVSWLMDHNVKLTEFKLKRATRIIQTAYLKHKHKDKVKTNSHLMAKALVYDVNASKSHYEQTDLRVVSTFQDIKPSDVEGIKFQPTIRA